MIIKMMEYTYWKIYYTSCEGNKRWLVARTPNDWDEYQLQDRICMSGGCGDDIDQIVSIQETVDIDYSLDFL